MAKFEQRNVSKLLLKTLEGITWFRSRLGCFLRVNISLDKTKILKLASEQSIPSKALEQAGLVIKVGDETMSIKLSDYQVKG